MAEFSPLTLWRRILALPNESRAKTVAVAFMVALVCAALVSGTTVVLRPFQDANRAAERQERLDAMMAELPGMEDILARSGADSLEAVIVDLAAGAVAEGVDPAVFNRAAFAADPATSTELSADDDIAGLGRRSDFQQIYLLRDGDDLRLILLPVSAVGYGGRIEALLALEGDLNTVAGLSITGHSETPGLGARIAEPGWQALWPGKEIADETGEIRLHVARGGASSVFEIDGITGATRTGNAVSNMITFWMGPFGYGPLLDALRSGSFRP
ncbi:NADH:ubiquinone reductase (Na(+)-transporting) subunit C [Pelagibacterium xiamenense]|uniref:NADH:ubiquinone reductase (Na(+)-transporting) subunit C n=1 Tax=Pelagibacterium xiamenense TaxID=2901140 RepID=UPI001E3328C5|nr:NADH:ubiquinone reductase (Na(+)-transporting) subunit C [Pelagibacterium xiamenense]MCD7059363.1 NADH:ubiquinone reductase (Na(+)-transporting) subunit C [Pelagibacterium xiamenense]